jgi:Cd2+/Zn2+-exporting ATPase
VIRQNMIIGIVFIVAFLALAGAGYVSPVMAALLHIASGLIVVFNSARLVRCGEEIEQEEASLPTGPALVSARSAFTHHRWEPENQM